jgi:hypothetical protein
MSSIFSKSKTICRRTPLFGTLLKLPGSISSGQAHERIFVEYDKQDQQGKAAFNEDYSWGGLLYPFGLFKPA